MKRQVRLALATVVFAAVAALPPALVLADFRSFEVLAWTSLAGAVAGCVVLVGLRSQTATRVSASLGARAGLVSFVVVLAVFASLQGRALAWSGFFVVAATFMCGWYALWLGGVGASFLGWLERSIPSEP